MIVVFLAGAFVFLTGVVTGATIVRMTLSDFVEVEKTEPDTNPDPNRW